tara:strand:+ start:690 stop:1346 length:657 start_codon:yes stop_codon:yes gene_type:complete
MSFCDNTCNKKFAKKDYKNCDKLETLNTIRYKSSLGDHYIDDTKFSKSEYFQHLTLPLVKPVRKTTPCGVKYLEPRPKPWHYICPRATCIICLVKTGQSEDFTNRNQFNYHRKANCPFKHIKYSPYIRAKKYDDDNTLSVALECISSDEEEEVKTPQPISDSESNESSEEEDETQTLGYRDTIEYNNKVKKGYANRSQNYKEAPISAIKLEEAINNVF